MSESNTSFSGSSPPLHIDQAAKPESCNDLAWSDEQRRERVCQAVVSLILKLEQAARSELPIAERLAMLRELKPRISKVTKRMPKPVASARRNGAAASVGQTMEQRINLLFSKNLKLALDDLDHSSLTYSGTSAKVRAWLLRNLFRVLGRQVEYSVRWDKSYPRDTWSMLHELYFYVSAREDVTGVLSDDRSDEAFDPVVEYKHSLLLGLVEQMVPHAERSSLLYEALPSLAVESRLEHPASYSGSFDMFVVEIARDEPPRVSGVLDYGFNGWVLEPAREFRDLVADRRCGGGSA
jgi:hypothetical protein